MVAGKLEAASRGPADLQVQLQQAQQQNQTLARILAERCEQAAAHVQNEQQVQAVWQELVEMQAVPSGASVQVGYTPLVCSMVSVGCIACLLIACLCECIMLGVVTLCFVSI